MQHFNNKPFKDVSTTVEMQLDMKMAASVAPGMGMPMASALKIGQYHTL